MNWEVLIQQNRKKHILTEREKIRKRCKEFMKNIWKFQVNETNFNSVFQASKTQHKGKLIIWVHSLEKENKDLMAKFNSC